MIEIRPQPIGIYPFPAANLLLPPVEVPHEAALPSLLNGDLDIELPEQWTFFAAAAKGDIETAIQLIRAQPRFVAHIGFQFVRVGAHERIVSVGWGSFVRRAERAA